MRFLLVNPPLAPTAEVAPPVGLCVLASALLGEGHTVSILDLDLELHGVISEPRQVANTHLLNRLASFSPDAVGITSMYNNSLQAADIAGTVKQVNPKCATIAGGPHFGAQGLESLQHLPQLDFVIEGEGEEALTKLAQYIEGSAPIEDVPNLCYRNAERLHRNCPKEQIDLLKVPPIWTTLGQAIDLDRYPQTILQGSVRRAVYIEAGRGCPFKCTFCAPAQFWKRAYRVKSIDTLVSEIKYLYSHLGYDSFMLIHDLLTFDKRFIKAFCERLHEEQLPIQWMANARVDLDLETMFPSMKKAGCWKLFFGIETASERLQAVIQKNLTTTQSVNTAHELAKAGIDATCSFVIGYPTETKAELSATLSLGAQLRLCGAETVQYHRLRLFPPAPMVKEKVEYSFDEETLKLEFPFPGITDWEVANIKNKPSLYTGYFAPTSNSGLPHQLAQVELFFQQLVTIAPVTLGSLGCFLGDRLVDAFYQAIEELSLIDRYSIDWVGADVSRTWSVLDPYLSVMVGLASKGCPKRNAILNGAREYERIRLMAMLNEPWQSSEFLFQSDNCAIVRLGCDVFGLIEVLKRGGNVSVDLASESHIMFVRGHDGNVKAFQGSVAC